MTPKYLSTIVATPLALAGMHFMASEYLNYLSDKNTKELDDVRQELMEGIINGSNDANKIIPKSIEKERVKARLDKYMSRFFSSIWGRVPNQPELAHVHHLERMGYAAFPNGWNPIVHILACEHEMPGACEHILERSVELAKRLPGLVEGVEMESIEMESYYNEHKNWMLNFGRYLNAQSLDIQECYPKGCDPEKVDGMFLAANLKDLAAISKAIGDKTDEIGEGVTALHQEISEEMEKGHEIDKARVKPLLRRLEGELNACVALDSQVKLQANVLRSLLAVVKV